MGNLSIADNTLYLVLKFTVMYWYKIWILNTMTMDIIYIKNREKNKVAFTKHSTMQSNLTSKKPYESDDSANKLYYSDYGANTGLWGENPCSAVIVLSEQKQLLIIFIFIHTVTINFHY